MCKMLSVPGKICACLQKGAVERLAHMYRHDTKSHPLSGIKLRLPILP